MGFNRRREKGTRLRDESVIVADLEPGDWPVVSCGVMDACLLVAAPLLASWNSWAHVFLIPCAFGAWQSSHLHLPQQQQMSDHSFSSPPCRPLEHPDRPGEARKPHNILPPLNRELDSRLPQLSITNVSQFHDTALLRPHPTYQLSATQSKSSALSLELYMHRPHTRQPFLPLCLHD